MVYWNPLCTGVLAVLTLLGFIQKLTVISPATFTAAPVDWIAYEVAPLNLAAPPTCPVPDVTLKFVALAAFTVESFSDALLPSSKCHTP